MVFDCADGPIGLNIHEQVTWAVETTHPMMGFPEIEADRHWWKAIAFEIGTEIVEIDAWRQSTLERYAKLAVELEPERKQCLKWVPKDIRKNDEKSPWPVDKSHHGGNGL